MGVRRDESGEIRAETRDARDASARLGCSADSDSESEKCAFGSSVPVLLAPVR
jgi:hypothetical protein